jgi:hypothetical protein
MTRFPSILVEPLYRLMYGRPLDDRLPFRDGADADVPAPCRGLVVVADGVGGLDLCGTALRYVLGAEGLPYAVWVFPWGHGFGRWYADLTRVANRDAKAALVADAVRRFKAARPGDPAFLVAKSGGSGVIVRALEQLDEGSVERAVLLAPALSPGYDLAAALRAVNREIVAFWSPLDVIVLGAGTRVFGTADRVKSVAAGMVGFRPPFGPAGAGSGGPHAKLRQVRWGLRMASSGYLGGHVGTDSPIFLRRYVVPLLRTSPSGGEGIAAGDQAATAPGRYP